MTVSLRPTGPVRTISARKGWAKRWVKTRAFLDDAGLRSDRTRPGWEVTRRRRTREPAARVVDVTARLRWVVVLHGTRPGRRGQGLPSSPAPSTAPQAGVEVRSRVGGRAGDSCLGSLTWVGGVVEAACASTTFVLICRSSSRLPSALGAPLSCSLVLGVRSQFGELRSVPDVGIDPGKDSLLQQMCELDAAKKRADVHRPSHEFAVDPVSDENGERVASTEQDDPSQHRQEESNEESPLLGGHSGSVVGQRRSHVVERRRRACSSARGGGHGRGRRAWRSGVRFLVGSGHTDDVTGRGWIERKWPRDAISDPRFAGRSGAVAELRVKGVVAGYAMLTVQDWATSRGRLWWKRLEDARTLPELHVQLIGDAETDPSTPPDSWFANEAAEVNRLFESCFKERLLEWNGGRYTIRWLDGPEAADVRDRWFWEPDDD